MNEKRSGIAPKKMPLYDRIRQILESARSSASRSVNTAQVVANWLIGREIVEEEQRGKRKAEYGQRLIAELSTKLQKDYGVEYSATNLKLFRQFFLAYPELISKTIGHTLSDELSLCDEGSLPVLALPQARISHTPCDQLWNPGHLHPNLSWSLYRHLIRVESANARSFYEIEAVKNNWAARELERQINSLLFERLAKSKDKAGLMRLARKGQEIHGPQDIFKDPVVMEFLGLPESPRLVESTLETALINNHDEIATNITLDALAQRWLNRTK